MSALAVNFDQKPEAALAYFRSKGLAAQYSYLDNSPEDHARDFMVAKMLDLDLLSDIRSAVDDALNHGLTFSDFRKHLTEVLQEKGWWGQQEMVDPVTGDTRTVQLGSPRRLRTIFDTNLSTAYAAGHWQKIVDNSANQPYLLYDAVDDTRTRPLHRSWDNKILRWDNPWWQTHFPPNGWGCRCSVIALNDDDLLEMGRKVDPDPTVETRNWVNPRTGSLEKVPLGIDPGWATNVGQNYLAQLGKQFIEKVGAAPADLGAVLWLTAITLALPAVETQFAQFVDDVYAAGVSANRTALVGSLVQDDIAFLATKGIEPFNAGILVEDRLLVGKKAARHEVAGNAFTVEEWKSVPAALAVPEAVLWDVANQTLLYIFPASAERTGKLAVRVNTLVKKQGINNVARTGFKVKLVDLKMHVKNGEYEVVRGSLD